MNHYTLVLTLTFSGISTEPEANFVRDHMILLAKMASYDASASYVLLPPEVVDEPVDA
jgi:hypothetical protein